MARAIGKGHQEQILSIYAKHGTAREGILEILKK